MEDCDETWHRIPGCSHRDGAAWPRAAAAAPAPAARRAGAPVNGGTLRAGIPATPTISTGALSYTNEGWEILEATNNGLLTFQKAAGGAGAQVVPDIATAMPTVTDGGRTYTFHLRSGVMFSPPVNREVKPSDFKFSIERLFRVELRRRRLLHRHRRRGQLRQDPARAASRASSPTTRR